MMGVMPATSRGDGEGHHAQAPGADERDVTLGESWHAL